MQNEGQKDWDDSQLHKSQDNEWERYIEGSLCFRTKHWWDRQENTEHGSNFYHFQKHAEKSEIIQRVTIS